jgi:hypothetical protein
MDHGQLKQVPMTKTGMLIRNPIADVFNAFVKSVWCSPASKRSLNTTSG